MDNLKTMLIVYNQKSDCKLPESIFEGEFNLLFTESGQEALDILLKESSNVSIVILDNFINNEDGYNVLREIKNRHELGNVPVIVTGYADKLKDIYTAWDLGAANVVIKPAEPEIIKKCVTDIIEKKESEHIQEKELILDTMRRYDEQDSMMTGLSKTVVCKNYFIPPKCFFSKNISKYFYGDYSQNNLNFTDLMQKNGVISSETAEMIKEYFNEILRSEWDRRNIVVQMKNNNGEWHWHRIEGIKSDNDNHDNCVILTIDNVNEEILYKKKLEYQTEFDQLTGIYNKLSFFKKTHEMLISNRDIKYVVVLWDIERFKIINDLLGSTVGDDILKHMGECMKTGMKNNGTYGRLNGDKFVMCFPYNKLNMEDIQTTFQKKINELTIDNFELVICFGLYIVNNPEEPVNLMCDRANLAQRTVKGNYMKRYAFYTDNMRKKLIYEQEIINEMDDALKSGQFFIYMQPQYDHLKNKIIGAEALVRWMHPKKGIIKPNLFINIFEQNGFIIKLDKFVCECACKEIRSLIDRGYTPVPISLNISRVDLYSHDFCSILSGIVKKYDVPASLINIEITESAYTENARQLVESIEKLKSYGFRIHMDDFGSGYSSLNTLKDVPVDVLKLDMRFLSGETNTGRGSNILNSILRMAEWIKLPVIAEGVETKNQADFLKNIGCSLVQGYYYSKPLSIPEFESLLLRNGHK